MKLLTVGELEKKLAYIKSIYANDLEKYYTSVLRVDYGLSFGEREKKVLNVHTNPPLEGQPYNRDLGYVIE